MKFLKIKYSDSDSVFASVALLNDIYVMLNSYSSGTDHLNNGNAHIEKERNIIIWFVLP